MWQNAPLDLNLDGSATPPTIDSPGFHSQPQSPTHSLDAAAVRAAAGAPPKPLASVLPALGFGSPMSVAGTRGGSVSGSLLTSQDARMSSQDVRTSSQTSRCRPANLVPLLQAAAAPAAAARDATPAGSYSANGTNLPLLAANANASKQVCSREVISVISVILSYHGSGLTWVGAKLGRVC